MHRRHVLTLAALDLTYCIRYSDVIVSSFSFSNQFNLKANLQRSLFCLPCSPPSFALMSTEDLIVEVVQFISTKQCVANPSLFEAVRKIVQRWQDNGMKGQYWGTVEGKPDNIYWILVWQSRAHAAAFAADPSYPEFVQRRESLATSAVRDIHVPVSGTPQPYMAPVTEVSIYTTHDSRIEKTHKEARAMIHLLRSLKPTGFHGSVDGVTLEDPTVGLYIAGWNTVQDHMRVGMEEGHEKFRETTEEIFDNLKDLTVAHVTFKKHGA